MTSAKISLATLKH